MSVLREEEIRPHELFRVFLSLAESDVAIHFASSPRRDLPCPACGHSGDPAFEKSGFAYRLCPDCQSMWVSPRPTFESFAQFYSRSQSARFWAEVFYPSVEEARREKLWRPKARRVAELCGDAGGGFTSLIDIGGGNGIFAEEFQAISRIPVTVIEPGADAVQACRNRGISVIEAFSEEVGRNELPAGRTVFTSFELFEHVHDPAAWLDHIAKIMRTGDLLIMTTLSGLGIDIQVLWDKSPSVCPPHHINFLNPTSIRQLGASVGLVPFRVWTPGELDLDILQNNLEVVEDRSWRTLLSTLDSESLSRLQSEFSSIGRSSHMWAAFTLA